MAATRARQCLRSGPKKCAAMPRRSGKLSFIRAVDYQRRVAGLSRGRQDEQGSLQKVVTLAGDRGFESISLQRGVLCEAYFRARGTEGSKLSLSSEESDSRPK